MEVGLGTVYQSNQTRMQERDDGMDGWMDDDVWPLLFVVDGCSCIET